MFAGLPNAVLYSAKMIEAEFSLRDDSVVTKCGTAFYVVNETGGGFLVTNRHILDAGYADSTGRYVGAKLKGVAIEGFVAATDDVDKLPVHRSRVALSLGDSELRFAAQYHEDVACFVNPKIVVPPSGSSKLSFFIQSTELADDEWINTNLSICDFLAFPGFPPWHDKRDMRPILRTGTISSDPRTSYSDSPAFKGRRIAYEGFSFGGSSGSPIFATQKGFRGDSVIQVSGFREGKVVGINAGHLAGQYQSHSGVSYFVRSSAILDLIGS